MSTKEIALLALIAVLVTLGGCEEEDSGSGGFPTQPGTQDPLPTNTPEDTWSGFDAGADTGATAPDTRQPADVSGPACTFNIDPYVADSCPGDQICILDGGLGQPGRCEGAFGRLYTVNIGAAQVPERRADGECWDVGCGAPDLFVEVLLDGVPVVRTGVAADTFRVEDFGGRGSVVLTAQSRLDLVLYDEDLSVNDQIIGCRLDPVTAGHLRTRVLLCGENTGPAFLFGLVIQ